MWFSITKSMQKVVMNNLFSFKNVVTDDTENSGNEN